MSIFETTNFKDKKVLVRVDFNVPLDESKQVTDNTRIVSALPTITKIIDDGGTPILMSHLGRPKGEKNEKYSFQPIASHLQNLLQNKENYKDINITIIKDYYPTLKQDIATLPKSIYILENLRYHKEEEKGDENFAKQLSTLGDYYVNDAFGTAHRAHASTSIIAKYFDIGKKMFGYLMEKEVSSGNKILHNSEKPLTAIIGGAKVSDKILILNNLLSVADNIIIGGGMAYTFLKAQGRNIGKSLFEQERLNDASNILSKAKEKGISVILPVDHHISKEFSESVEDNYTDNANIPNDFMGLDIGEKSITLFHNEIIKSKTILWNGPMGVFEMDKFKKGTKHIALSVAEATEKGAFSLIGGGDSVAAINVFQLRDKISYVSTGGGALLEFFEGKSLPGIKAIQE